MTSTNALTERQIRHVQRSLNDFTDKYLTDVAKIRVDGELDAATRKRVRMVKYYLGHGPKRDGYPGERFRRQLTHPRTSRYSSKTQLERAESRRKEQREEERAEAARRRRTTGASPWRGGKTVANWLHPYLDYAKGRGWPGWVTSGYRTPEYSESICREMCNAPSCPGRCAGRASNHSGSTKPAGAIDVSFYAEFGHLMERCPLSPRIFNALGQQDPVHFSASGA